MLDAPVDLARLAANDNRVTMAALIEFVWAATDAGIRKDIDKPVVGDDDVLVRVGVPSTPVTIS